VFRRAPKELDTVRQFCLGIDLAICRRDKQGHKDDCPERDRSTGIALKEQLSAMQFLRARYC
jgi:hypothetical protein